MKDFLQQPLAGFFLGFIQVLLFVKKKKKKKNNVGIRGTLNLKKKKNFVWRVFAIMSRNILRIHVYMYI